MRDSTWCVWEQQRKPVPEGMSERKSGEGTHREVRGDLMGTGFVGHSKYLTGFSSETGAPGGLEQRRSLSLWKCCSGTVLSISTAGRVEAGRPVREGL